MQTKVEQFFELTKECQKGRPRKEKPHSEMFANFRRVEVAEKAPTMSCPVVITEGQVCSGWREKEDRIKYGCEGCERFARRW